MPLRKPALLGAAIVSAAFALPAVASAKDFCVGAPAGCAGTSVPAADDHGVVRRAAPGIEIAEPVAHAH